MNIGPCSFKCWPLYQMRVVFLFKVTLHFIWSGCSHVYGFCSAMLFINLNAIYMSRHMLFFDYVNISRDTLVSRGVHSDSNIHVCIVVSVRVLIAVVWMCVCFVRYLNIKVADTANVFAKSFWRKFILYIKNQLSTFKICCQAPQFLCWHLLNFFVYNTMVSPISTILHVIFIYL